MSGMGLGHGHHPWPTCSTCSHPLTRLTDEAMLRLPDSKRSQKVVIDVSWACLRCHGLDQAIGLPELRMSAAQAFGKGEAGQ